MKNVIRSKGKICLRRSKNLTSGEIECPRCGKWDKVKTLTDKHFNEEYFCSTCRKELKSLETKTESTKVNGNIPKRRKSQWAIDCPHKPFFGCKVARECTGCYYNPDQKIALIRLEEDDPKKTAKMHWFYGDKSHVKKSLKLLEEIKVGKGIHKGGNRSHFKYARKSEDE